MVFIKTPESGYGSAAEFYGMRWGEANSGHSDATSGRGSRGVSQSPRTLAGVEVGYNGAVTIAVLRVRMRLPSRTLKEKRTIVKSVVERLRNKFNASVAETDDLDEPGIASIAAAVISNDSRHADEQAQAIASAIEEWRLDAEVLEIEVELIQA